MCKQVRYSRGYGIIRDKSLKYELWDDMLCNKIGKLFLYYAKQCYNAKHENENVGNENVIIHV